MTRKTRELATKIADDFDELHDLDRKARAELSDGECKLYMIGTFPTSTSDSSAWATPVGKFIILSHAAEVLLCGEFPQLEDAANGQLAIRRDGQLSWAAFLFEESSCRLHGVAIRVKPVYDYDQIPNPEYVPGRSYDAAPVTTQLPWIYKRRRVGESRVLSGISRVSSILIRALVS